MTYAVGHISGGHFNPAVSLGLWAGGKFETKNLIGYILARFSDYQKYMLKKHPTTFLLDPYCCWFYT